MDDNGFIDIGSSIEGYNPVNIEGLAYTPAVDYDEGVCLVLGCKYVPFEIRGTFVDTEDLFDYFYNYDFDVDVYLAKFESGELNRFSLIGEDSERYELMLQEHDMILGVQRYLHRGWDEFKQVRLKSNMLEEDVLSGGEVDCVDVKSDEVSVKGETFGERIFAESQEIDMFEDNTLNDILGLDYQNITCEYVFSLRFIPKVESTVIKKLGKLEGDPYKLDVPFPTFKELDEMGGSSASVEDMFRRKLLNLSQLFDSNDFHIEAVQPPMAMLSDILEEYCSFDRYMYWYVKQTYGEEYNVLIEGNYVRITRHISGELEEKVLDPHEMLKVYHRFNKQIEKIKSLLEAMTFYFDVEDSMVFGEEFLEGVMNTLSEGYDVMLHGGSVGQQLLEENEELRRNTEALRRDVRNLNKLLEEEESKVTQSDKMVQKHTWEKEECRLADIRKQKMLEEYKKSNTRLIKDAEKALESEKDMQKKVVIMYSRLVIWLGFAFFIGFILGGIV